MPEAEGSSAAEVVETYADWFVIRDAEGEIFRVDRHSRLHIGSDAVARIEATMETIYDTNQLAMLATVRACIQHIQGLEAEKMPAEGEPS